MLFLKSWLEDYIDLTDTNDQDLSKILSIKSGEVENTKTVNDYFDKKVLVGKIKNLRKHTDKLQIFEVDFGDKIKSIQIISAATNVVEGLICPVALVGCHLAYQKIVERKMFGQTSFGMCLGKSELMLETEMSQGLWELNKEKKFKDNLTLLEQKIGQPISKVFPEFFPVETIFDIKYLADKFSTCSSHLGLALEISFLLKDTNKLRGIAKELLDSNSKNISSLNLGELSDLPKDSKNFSIQKPKQEINIQTNNSQNSSKNLENQTDFNQPKSELEPKNLKINLEDSTKYANNFCLYEVNLAKNFLLPAKLQKRMLLTQKNLVDSFADFSNYLLWDVGQPSHFFSLDKIFNLLDQEQDSANLDSTTSSKTNLEKDLELNWEIKKTSEETKFLGLGQLKDAIIPAGVEILVQKTKNGEEVLSIPGISGSQKTKTEFADQRILIEVANFSAERVAKSSFLLNYRSDGCRFWCSGVKPVLSDIWLKQFVNILDSNEINFEHRKIFELKNNLPNNSKNKSAIKIDFDYISSRLDSRGVDFWQPKIEKILKLIGNLEGDNFYSNSYYGNILTLEDILSEVARFIGFDFLQKNYFEFGSDLQQNSNFESILELKKLFTNYNFNEVILRPFVAQKHLFGSLSGGDNSRALEAISFQRKDENFLQDSFIANLLKVLSQNLKKGEKETKIFQFGKVYNLDKFFKLKENTQVEAVMCSQDPYILTSLVHQLAKKMNGELNLLKEELKSDNKNSQNWENLGKTVTYEFVSSQKTEYTWNLVEIKNTQKKAFDIDLGKKTWYLRLNLPQEFDFDIYKKYFNESDFSSIKRNYSWILPKGLKWALIQKSIQETEILDSQIFKTPLERFLDKEVKEESEILNFEVEFLSYSRTLEGKEITDWEERLLENLKEKGYQINLRKA